MTLSLAALGNLAPFIKMDVRSTGAAFAVKKKYL